MYIIHIYTFYKQTLFIANKNYDVDGIYFPYRYTYRCTIVFVFNFTIFYQFLEVYFESRLKK